MVDEGNLGVVKLFVNLGVVELFLEVVYHAMQAMVIRLVIRGTRHDGPLRGMRRVGAVDAEARASLLVYKWEQTTRQREKEKCTVGGLTMLEDQTRLVVRGRGRRKTINAQVEEGTRARPRP